MKKIIFVFVAILLLTGCSSEYNLRFENQMITEEIIGYIPSNYDQEDISLDSGVPEPDNEYEFIFNDNLTPFINDKGVVYNKIVDEQGDYTKITWKYSFLHEEFQNSSAFNLCFEDASIIANDEKYDLTFSGMFSCLYGEELKINITTPNKVLSHNAHSQKGNTYTWIVNDENVKDLVIQMEISKTVPFNWVYAGIVVAVIAVIAIPIMYVISKIKNREKINEI